MTWSVCPGLVVISVTVCVPLIFCLVDVNAGTNPDNVKVEPTLRLLVNANDGLVNVIVILPVLGLLLVTLLTCITELLVTKLGNNV